MSRRTIIYRGSIKSCNYRCFYCPFSKHPASAREMERDRAQWFSFVRRVAETGGQSETGAVLVAPYGEALIHPWYWEGLAELSALPWIDAAGAQTNLSFPEELPERFAAFGGAVKKLRLWATFHPEMTDAAAFADRCRALIRRGVTVCAGAVGAPGAAEVLRELRRLLPEECYFWINRMDGMKRTYTEEEKQVFSELDPYFYRELLCHPADPAQCAGRLMAEGDGRLHTCNISPVQKERWRHPVSAEGAGRIPAGVTDAMSKPIESKQLLLPAVCNRKRCSCYLAYGGRENLVNQLLFGPYPVFRIPRRPKAVFLDIVGTLLLERPDRGGESERIGVPGCEGENARARLPGQESERIGVPGCEGENARARHSGRYKEPDEELVTGLRVLRAQGVPLFLATTLPYREAAKRCQRIWHLFSGGVFSGGAQICMTADEANGRDGTENRSFFYELEEEILLALERRKADGYRILKYRNAGRLYKITLCRAARRPWSAGEAEEICGDLLLGYRARYLIEGHCLQIISDRADKAAGVRMICSWLGISPNEAFAAGDSPEDRGMCALCGSHDSVSER